MIEALEASLRVGQGKVSVHAETETWKFSSDLHCADCDIHYSEPTPAAFSFNSPLGACETCRGFGRTIGIDWKLVIPDDSLSLFDGAIKPFRSGYSMECQEDLVRFGRKRGMDLGRAGVLYGVADHGILVCHRKTGPERCKQSPDCTPAGRWLPPAGQY